MMMFAEPPNMPVIPTAMVDSRELRYCRDETHNTTVKDLKFSLVSDDLICWWLLATANEGVLKITIKFKFSIFSVGVLQCY